MSDKVIGGTPRGIESKCTTCRAAQVMRGVNLQSVIYCQSLPRNPRITFPVEECSLYDDKRNPSLYDMQQIAWEVHSRNRGPVGFGDGVRHMEVVISPPEPRKDQPMPTTTPGR